MAEAQSQPQAALPLARSLALPVPQPAQPEPEPGPDPGSAVAATGAAGAVAAAGAAIAEEPAHLLPHHHDDHQQKPELQAQALVPPEADADANVSRPPGHTPLPASSQSKSPRAATAPAPARDAEVAALPELGHALAQDSAQQSVREKDPAGNNVHHLHHDHHQQQDQIHHDDNDDHHHHDVSAASLTATSTLVSPASSPDGLPTTTAAVVHPPTSSRHSPSSKGAADLHIRKEEQDGGVPVPAAMSNNPPHAPGPPRPSLNYSTPGAYSTAGLGGAPYGYPGSAGPTHDPFRAQNSLPSMRTFDPVQQQHQQQQHMAVAMPMTPVGSVPGQQPMSYYGQHVPMGGLAGNAYGGLPPEVLGPRYALPPNGPGAVLATGRHKKEIKRRTKTGCMTCRKRRIKCDEQHPVCKNCQKSKRECLGYDPIFKNQQQHPTNIQPAPNHASSPSPAISNGPQAPLASVSAGPSYAQLPAVGSNSASPANTSFNPVAISAAGGATHIKSEALEYPSIDPTLDGVLTTPTPRMRVHDLVAMGGAAPPPLRENVGKEKLDDVQELYVQVYAPGLQKFFESDWYTQSPGLTALASNMSVIETVAAFLQSVSKTDANDIASMQYAANLEFRVVWELAALVYISEYKINAGEHLPSPSDGSETRNRVLVFETLLSGDFLDQNLLQAPLSTLENPANPEYFRNREFKFWYWLAEFLRVRDQPTVDSTPQREHILAQMRDILDGRENRDVLYSIAVIRTLAPNFPPGSSAANLPDHLDESDPQSKLHVARKFIQDESQVNTGTTNVVRRFAELAVRAFIVPGSNVTRRQ